MRKARVLKLVKTAKEKLDNNKLNITASQSKYLYSIIKDHRMLSEASLTFLLSVEMGIYDKD